MFERIQSEPGRVRLHLRGGLDGESSRALRDGLCALTTVEAREVVIDLSNVTYLDGSGVGALSFLFKRLTARGRRLTISGVAGQPLAMLRQLGLDGLLGLDREPRRRVFALRGFAWAR
jgi:anti-anti-sigma factor